MKKIVGLVPGVIGTSLVPESLVTTYVQKLSKCSNIGTIRSGTLTDDSCPPEEFNIQEQMSPVQRGAVIGTGGTGLVMESRDGRFALKIPKFDVPLWKMKSGLCRERALAEYIEDTGSVDFIPKLYHPTRDSVPATCDPYLVVTDKVGPFSLHDLHTTVGGLFSHNRRELKEISIRLIGMLKILNAVEFIHGDLNAGNILFSDPENIAGTLWFIDLGFGKLVAEPDTRRDELWVDLLAVVNGLVALSRDRFGRPDVGLVEIHADLVGELRSIHPTIMRHPDFESVIAALSRRLDSSTSAGAVTGVPVYREDRDQIRWEQVRRVREALHRIPPLETHLETISAFAQYLGKM